MNPIHKISFAIILIYILSFSTSLFGQTDQEFWFVAPEVNDQHGGNAGGQPTYLRLATYDLPSTITITQPANPLFVPIVVNIPANDNRSIEFRKGGGGAGVYDLNLIENVIQAPIPGRPGNMNNVGLKISSTSNITAYYEISSTNNREIIALKGRNAVGREFYVPFQTEFPTYFNYDLLYSAIDIVATQATTVNIRPTVPMLIVATSGDVVIPAGATHSFPLNMGETFSAVPYGVGSNSPYNISRSNRLAGTRVWSADSCLAVQTKDDLVHDSHAICTGCGGDIDYVADQLVPTNLLGQTHVVMTGQITTVPEYVYVLATENNTTVSLNGVPLLPIIGEGQQKTIRIDNLASNFNLIETDKPVVVYHVSGFAGQMGGSILPQIDVCTGSQEVVFTRPQAGNFEFFMNILVRKGAENNFQLNGVGGLINPIGGWTEIVPNEWMAGTINANFVAAQIAQTISNTDVFHLGIINGYGNADCFYGYFSDFNKLDVSATIVGTIDGSKVLCYGKSTQLIASKGNSYLWTADAIPYYISDPTSQNPTVSPLSNKKYKVVVEGGCNIKDSAYAEIIVSDPIEASFSLSDALGCAPMHIAIVNHSEDNWPVTNYKWDMNGDGTPEYTTGPDTIYHTFTNNTTNPITYPIKLRTENVLRCKDSLYADITVYPAIHADFEPDTSGCNPLMVPFKNLSHGHTGSYNWKFGDGGTATLFEPIHTYHNHTSTTQTYTAQLIATAPSLFCKDTITKAITVEPAMYAQFHIDKNLGCDPLIVTPTNQSSPVSIDSYKWIWGDGDTTYTQVPGSHTYNNTSGIPETYIIKLIAYKGACTDTISESVTVNPGVTAQIGQDINLGCQPLTVNFEDLSTGIVADQKWLFGDGTVANNNLLIAHEFKNFSSTDTTYTTQLIVASASGCRDTAEVTTTVHPAINASFSPNYIKGCADLDVLILNQSGGAIDTYEWNWGDGSPLEYVATPLGHTYINPTNATITRNLQLVVFNAANCSDTTMHPIQIYPVADASFTASPLAGCNPLTVDFQHTPINAVPVQLNWDFGDNSFGSQPLLSHIYEHQDATSQSFQVELTARTTNGCTDTVRTTIDVGSYMNLAFDLDTAKGCSPLSVNIQNNSTGGIDSYTWKKEDVTFSTNANPGSITFYNNSDVPIDTIITLIGINSGGSCIDSLQKTITIYPSVDATFTQNITDGCNPLTVNFTHTPINNPTVTWNWTFGDINTASIANPSNIFENTSNNPATYRTKLIVQSVYNCIDSSQVDINVASYLQPNFTMNKSKGCSPLTIELEDKTIGEVTSRTWTKSGDVFATNNANPTITLFNNTNNPIDTIITLTVGNSGPGTCQASISKTVTIHPSVDATFIANIEQGCNPLTVDFTHTPFNNPNMNLFWDFKDNQSSTISSPQHTFTNGNTTPTIYDVELKVESTFGCKDSTNLPITVAPFLHARLSADKTKGCSPLQIRFTDISEGSITSRTWQRNGLTFSNAANPQLQFINTSNQVAYDTITFIITNGGPGSCADTAIQIITIYPEVDATFTHAITEGCNPLQVNFTHTPTQTIPVNYYWEFGDEGLSNLASPQHLFENPLTTAQTYEIKLLVESTNGCKDSTYSQVEVASRLKANFTMPISSGCSPFTANFTDASEGDIATRSWYVDGNLLSTGNNASTSIINNGNANIVQNIKLVVTNAGPGNCADSITKQITAYPKPVANFSIDDNRGCNPHTANFTYLPGTSTLNVTHDWQFGDNNSSTQQDPMHVFEHFNYNNISTYDITLTSKTQYDCKTSTTQTVTVERALEAMFTLDPSSDCNPFNATLKNSSKGVETYQWVYGDGSPNFNTTTPQNVVHTYTNNSYNNQATYEAKLITTNTGGICTDSISRTIKVHPLLKASFEADIQEDCHPANVNFTNHSQGADLRYYWNFDDLTNSTEASPQHLFVNTSNTNDKYFNVNLKIKNAFECQDDTTLTIRVNHLPKSQFTINQTENCAPLEILATNTSIGYNNFEWRLGNGETNQSAPLNYTYNNTGSETQSFELELFTETNRNCKDSTSLTLNAYPQVEANFNIVSSQGCNPLTTAFENLSTNATNYYWDFGNGRTSNQTNPTSRFAITGYQNQTFPIKLIASSTHNCIDSINKQVTVYVQPEADFEATPFSQQYPASTVTLLDLSNDGPFNYIWNFGDGNQSTIASPEPHIYDTWGTYTIDLAITNNAFNCTDQTSQQITIDPPMVTAAFTASDTTGCVPLEIHLEAEASQFAGDNYSYFWDFGDGNTSTEQTPTHTYDTAALYMVTLTVIGQDGAMNASKKIRAYPLPEVSFTMEPRLVMIPDDRTQCYNLTQFGQTYLWNFGDGTTSTEKNPSHYYSEEGFYSVTLTATSPHGCVASLSKDGNIEVRGKGLLQFPNAFTPSLAGSSDGIYDPESPNNNVFHPQAEGVTKYKLLIYNRWGELMFESKNINIGWDGYYNGKICPQDVYIWKVEGKFINGKTFEQTGDVTLLR